MECQCLAIHRKQAEKMTERWKKSWLCSNVFQLIRLKSTCILYGANKFMGDQEVRKLSGKRGGKSVFFKESIYMCFLNQYIYMVIYGVTNIYMLSNQSKILQMQANKSSGPT